MTTGARPLPAVVLVAHHQPAQFRRLVAALDPLPVFAHVDANTPDDVFAAMTDGLGARVRLLPRRRAGWASPAVLLAELDGYRAALEETDADHLILLTGACYPLRSTESLVAYLASVRGKSLAYARRMPLPEWRPLGGFDRILAPQRADGRRRRIVGAPRPWPRGLRPAGGSQQKILCRAHAAAVVDVLDRRPDLAAFLTSCWTPDEVAIPTLLRSPLTGIDWAGEHVGLDMPWFIDWRPNSPNPVELSMDHFDAIRAAAQAPTPDLFCRKVGPASDALVDRIDAELRRD